MSLIAAGEKPHLSARWSLDKFEDKSGEVAAFLQSGGSIEDAVARFGNHEWIDMGENLMLNAGITVLLNLLVGAGGQTNFSATNARVGVGTSSTAAVATQTGIQAGAFYQGMDGTYPQVSSQTVTFRATIASGNGNQSWQEFIIDNYAATGGTSYTTSSPTYSSTLVALNRLVSNQGTKTSGQTWILTISVTES